MNAERLDSSCGTNGIKPCFKHAGCFRQMLRPYSKLPHTISVFFFFHRSFLSSLMSSCPHEIPHIPLSLPLSHYPFFKYGLSQTLGPLFFLQLYNLMITFTASSTAPETQHLHLRPSCRLELSIKPDSLFTRFIHPQIFLSCSS